MITDVWPGNASGRAVVEADWFAMPFAPDTFGAALADGALNMLHWPEGYRDIAGELCRVIAPGGRIVIRCFVMPDPPESLAHLTSETMAGRVLGFHAFKWRLAMAARHEGATPNIASRGIWEAFEACFPDRERLARATGWAIDIIDEIDDYAVSMLTKSFPTRAELIAAIPDARLIEATGYELSECCPLLVIDTP